PRPVTVGGVRPTEKLQVLQQMGRTCGGGKTRPRPFTLDHSIGVHPFECRCNAHFHLVRAHAMKADEEIPRLIAEDESTEWFSSIVLHRPPCRRDAAGTIDQALHNYTAEIPHQHFIVIHGGPSVTVMVIRPNRHQSASPLACSRRLSSSPVP